MRNILIIACALIMCSCANNRYEIFTLNNVSPEVTLNTGELGNDGVWRATERIKLGLKIDPVPLNISFTANDIEGSILSLAANFNESLEISYNDGSQIEFPIVFENNEEISFNILANEIGDYPVELFITDELGNTSRAIVTIDAFVNMNPIAVLTKEAEAYGIPSPSVYQINANQSYDQDSDWGGSIVQYVWKIDNGQEFITETPYFRQSFNNGGYSISLYVVDNDGEKSETVQEVITIR